MSIKTRLIFLMFCTVIFLIFLSSQIRAQEAVRVWEEPLTLPTYLVDPPNPNPMFYTGRAYQGAEGHIYPYPLLDDLTDKRKNVTYNAVYLENEYIKLCMLPEIGGRIFYAQDKTNRYELFYHQHVIKPALIGMLGAWISGGIEWSIPHHHRATSFLPVDYTLSENPDGSKTIWIGELELRHRMQWCIGITLYPHSSIIEAKGKLFNRTQYAHSFLHWANVAVHANDTYQIIFPPEVQFATYHGKNQFCHWPIAREEYHRVDYSGGVDISWYKNLPAPTSCFAWNCTENFLAGYDHGKDAGVIHVADPYRMPGKKFWTWGTGAKGQMWEHILTEKDGPYIELMVGAYSDNQPDYSWIQPNETKVFTHTWYPLKEIGGVKKANRKAAVNVEKKDDTLCVTLNTTADYSDTRVELIHKEKLLLDTTVSISPEKPFKTAVACPHNFIRERMQLSLLSSDGDTLIHYSPQSIEQKPMPEPVEPPPAPEKIDTIEELYFTGLRLQQFHNPALEPEPYFLEALEREANNSRVNTALGIIDCLHFRFQKAEERLRRAAERSTKNYTHPRNTEALYYLGVALREQGNYEEAYECFARSAWDYDFHSSSYYQMAELCCRNHNFEKALENINRSLLTNSFNIKALNLKTVILRKLHRYAEAESINQEAYDLNPLDFWTVNESALISNEKNQNKKFTQIMDTLKNIMRDELQSYLELSLNYSKCGFFEEAIDILHGYVTLKDNDSEVNPLPYYYLGYYYFQSGEEDKMMQYYQQAKQQSPEFCFPFRRESYAILSHAMNQYPDDARTHYYLGNLLYEHQPEKAIQHWERSRDLNDDFARVHRNVAFAYSRVLNEIPQAIKSMEKAVKQDPADSRFYYELDVLYEMGKVSIDKRWKAMADNVDVISQHDDPYSRYITLLVLQEEYTKALDKLLNHHFHVWEGGGSIHNVYVNACLLRGLERFDNHKYDKALHDFRAALEYPDNMEVGPPPVDRNQPKIRYYCARVLEAMGDTIRAEELYTWIADCQISGAEVTYYKSQSLRKLNKDQAADSLLTYLIRQSEERLDNLTTMDFFAKFGEKQSQDNQRAAALYQLGLAYLGKGERQEAQSYFEKALRYDPYHLWAQWFTDH